MIEVNRSQQTKTPLLDCKDLLGIGPRDYIKMAKGTKALSCRETTMLVVLALLFLICTVLVVLVALQTGSSQTTSSIRDGARSKKPNMCLTADCVELAGKTLANMDLSVDPCDDFYEYVCGGYLDKTFLKHDEDFRDISGDVTERLIKVLKDPATTINGKESTAVKKAKTYFAACVNATTTPEYNVTAALQKYIESLGGWPLSGSFDAGMADVESTAAKTTKNGIDGIFALFTDVNIYNNSKYMLKITLLDPNVYIGEGDNFQTYIEEVVGTVGGDVNAGASVIADMVEIQGALADIYPPPAAQGNLTYGNHLLTLQQIQDLIGPNFQMSDYLRNVLGFSVSPKMKLLVAWPDRLAGLKAIFDTFPDESLVAYFVWTSLVLRLEQVASLYNDPTLDGVKECAILTNYFFTQVLGALYVQEYYDETATATFEEMQLRIRQAFLDNLNSLDWMDDVSKEKSREKTRVMKQIIAHFNISVDAAALDRAYRYIDPIVQDDYFTIYDNLLKSQVVQNLAQRGKRPTLFSSLFNDMGPAEVNAIYEVQLNAILLWAGLLRYAYYDEDFLSAMKYGSTGVVLGHELTHGYDTTGMEFDKNGNMRQWMSDASLAGFKNRTTCLVEQYNDYEVLPGEKVDGALTLAENIADNGGIKLAFEAYRSWKKARGAGAQREPRLPGLLLTNEQMFFVAMAMPYCWTGTEDYTREMLVLDTHSPYRYRVIGPLSNYDKFGETFNCPIGSYMNPKERCILW